MPDLTEFLITTDALQLERCQQNRCPACGSSEIEGQEIEVCAGTCHQDVDCLECGSEWRETYTLSDFGFYTMTKGDDHD